MSQAQNYLQYLRNKVEKGQKEGCVCPVCDQYVKEYRRNVDCSMAYTLILLYRYALNHGKKEWIHALQYLNSIENIPHTLHTCGISKLCYWELLKKRRDIKREDGCKHTGFYRVTKKGAYFVERKIKIPKYVYLYNNKIKRFSTEYISIDFSLGKKFNYQEIMKIDLEFN